MPNPILNNLSVINREHDAHSEQTLTPRQVPFAYNEQIPYYAHTKILTQASKHPVPDQRLTEVTETEHFQSTL